MQLLSKQRELPNMIFSPINQLFDSQSLMNMLNNKTISSFSLKIIDCCISKRKRESAYLSDLKQRLNKINKSNDSLSFEIEDDSMPCFNDIYGFKMAVEHTIEIIESYTYYFDRGKRVLIPISLTTLQNNDFGL